MAGLSAVQVIQAIAAIIGAGAAVKSATNETNISEENTGQPGGPTFGGAGPFNTPTPGVGDIGALLASIGGGGATLDQPVANAAAAGTATNQAAQVAPSDPGLSAPGGDAGKDTSKEVTPPAGTETDIGQILAAIPQALLAAGSLLGINDTNTITQRPAPIAGGGGGGLVGQFNRPIGQQPDIGQLLAALPGLR